MWVDPARRSALRARLAQGGHGAGGGVDGGQAGHGVDGDGTPSSAAQVADTAGELDGLTGVGKAQAGHGGHLQGTDLDPAVAVVAGPVQYGDGVPWQRGELGVQPRLVAFAMSR